MKRVLLVCSVLIISFCGCSPEHAAGVGVGATAVRHTLLGAQADLEAQIQAKNEELAEVLARLDAATTEAETLAVDAERLALLEKIRKLETASAGVGLAAEAGSVNWTDPAAVGGYAGTALSLLLAALYRKQSAESRNKYKAHRAGAEAFMRAAEPTVGAELYDLIGEERKTRGVL